MKLKYIQRTPSQKKEFKAVFELDNKSTKTIRFGTKSNFVLNKNKTEKDRQNYIKRHRVNENHNNPLSAGSLSRHILWGKSRNIKTNEARFRAKFNLK